MPAGDGINVYAMDHATGAWRHVQLVGDLVNPSFLAFDGVRRCLALLPRSEDHSVGTVIDLSKLEGKVGRVEQPFAKPAQWRRNTALLCVGTVG